MFNSNASAVSGDVNYIEDVFSTYLYTGTGAAQSIVNNLDLSTKGGLVWIKDRDGGGYASHYLADTTTGRDWKLSSDTTSAKYGIPAGYDLTSFNSNGFSVGSPYVTGVNNSGDKIVSWTFREQAKFFDVVTGTCDGSGNITVNHSLGATPGFVTIKRTDGVSAWYAYHTSLGNNQYIQLNGTDAAATLTGIWSATSTTFTANVGFAAGAQVVLYLWASNAGGFGLTGTDNVVSCGSFTVSSNVATVSLGYEPQWTMMKRTDSTDNWRINDVMRGSATAGGQNASLQPDTAAAESSGTAGTHPTATGFTVQGITDGTYIYVAIRRGPMKVPTDGTKVFNPSVRASGTGAAVSTTGVGFPPDLLISTERTTGVLFAKGWHDRLRGSVILISNSTNNEAADSTGVTAYGQDGFSFGADSGFATVNYSGSNYVYEALRRAPGFFDEVCYTGTGAAQTLTHNLAAVPELMISKRRDAVAGWAVYSAALGATKYMRLQTDDAPSTGSTLWNDTAPTATQFTLGSTQSATGGTYVQYLFATCPGVSKVGSYTGTATTQQINCGFTAGARFVLIKRTDSTGDWYVWDSARGIVSGNDPYFLLNTNAAEVTLTDYVDTYAAGFELSSTAPAAINASGGSYIFLAIA